MDPSSRQKGGFDQLNAAELGHELLHSLLSGVRRAICWQCFLALSSSELPAFGVEVVLGMFLADDLLAFLSQSSEILSRLPPHGHVYESRDLLASAIAVVEELVVSDRGGCHWSSRISLSQRRVGDQVTTDDDAINIHEF